MEYPEILKQLMHEKKLSVSQIARIVKQSEKSIYNYTSGRNEPTYSVLRKIIVEIKDLDVRWFMTGTHETEASIKNEDGNKPGYVSEIAEKLSDCERRLSSTLLENGYLKQQIADKDEIISLLKNKGNGTL